MTVGIDSPASSATRVTPPWPSAPASAPHTKRRRRSPRCGRTRSSIFARTPSSAESPSIWRTHSNHAEDSNLYRGDPLAPSASEVLPMKLVVGLTQSGGHGEAEAAQQIGRRDSSSAVPRPDRLGMRVEEAPDGFRGVDCRGWWIQLQPPRDRRVRARLAGPLVTRTGDGDQLDASTARAVRDRRGDRTGGADRGLGAVVDPAPGADECGHRWSDSPSGCTTGSNPATSATPHWSDAARGTLMASRRPVSAGFKAYCTGGRHAGHDP